LGTGAGSFVAQVEGVLTGALLDPDRSTVAWFGSRQCELQTVEDLQEAISEYAVLGSDLRAALEAERTGRADQPSSPPASRGPMLAVAKPSPRVEDQPPPNRSRRGVLVGLALLVVWMLMVLVLVLALATDL
jgi:hypothetical protein